MNSQKTSSGGAKLIKGYKYRIYPNKEQLVILNKSLGCGRFIWNQLLAMCIQDYEKWKNDSTLPKPNTSGIGLTYNLLPLKQEFPWLYEVSHTALQQKAHDLGRAFSNFFISLKKGKKVGYPKFKKKNHHESFKLLSSTDSFRFKEGRFYIAKCETPIKVKWSRELPSKPTSCSISKTSSDEWYVSFTCETPPKLTNGREKIGLDLGLTHFVTDSNGNKIDNPRHFLALQKKLGRLQRQHGRKQKGSKNREKSRLKVAKLHQHIANMRNDFLHKLSRQLVNENQVIGIESLNVAGMMRNGNLAKHISDAGWGAFVKFLEYKVRESHHAKLVEMDPFFPSSHICSNCFTKLDRKLKLSERTWSCSCGTKHDRDINASKVIRHLAIKTVEYLKPIGGEILIADVGLL
jgi:putative transposase